MNVAKQLYQLQEVDLEIDSDEQAIRQLTSQLGESEVVIGLRQKLSVESRRLEELKQQQRSLEWEIDDLSKKFTDGEKKLYSGQIRNPKELTSLQQEIDGLKTRHNQLQNNELEIMGQIELATESVATIGSELKEREAEWQRQQQQLSVNLEQLKTILANLQHRRQLLTAEIDTQVTEVYQALKKQKGIAVAKVAQGICGGCRISLPVSELQLTRSGKLVRCSSCGRLLFLA